MRTITALLFILCLWEITTCLDLPMNPADITDIYGTYGHPRRDPIEKLNEVHTGVDFAATFPTNVLFVGDGYLHWIEYKKQDVGHSVACYSNGIWWIYTHIKLTDTGESSRQRSIYKNKPVVQVKRNSDLFLEVINNGDNTHLDLEMRKGSLYVSEDPIRYEIERNFTLDNPLCYMNMPDTEEPKIDPNNENIKFYQKDDWSNPISLKDLNDENIIVSGNIGFDVNILDQFKPGTYFISYPVGIFAFGYKITDINRLEKFPQRMIVARNEIVRWDAKIYGPSGNENLFHTLVNYNRVNPDSPIYDLFYKVSNCTGGDMDYKNLLGYWNTKLKTYGEWEENSWKDSSADRIEEAHFPDGIYNVIVLANDWYRYIRNMAPVSDTFPVRVDNFDPKVMSWCFQPENDSLSILMSEELDTASLMPENILIINKSNNSTSHPSSVGFISEYPQFFVTMTFSCDSTKEYDIVFDSLVTDYAGKKVEDTIRIAAMKLKKVLNHGTDNPILGLGEDSVIFVFNQRMDIDKALNSVVALDDSGDTVSSSVSFSITQDTMIVHLLSCDGNQNQLAITIDGDSIVPDLSGEECNVGFCFDGDSDGECGGIYEYHFVRFCAPRLIILQTKGDVEIETAHIQDMPDDTCSCLPEPPYYICGSTFLRTHAFGFSIMGNFGEPGAHLMDSRVESYSAEAKIIATPGLKLDFEIDCPFPEFASADTSLVYDTLEGIGTFSISIPKISDGLYIRIKAHNSESVYGSRDSLLLTFIEENYSMISREITGATDLSIDLTICEDVADSTCINVSPVIATSTGIDREWKIINITYRYGFDCASYYWYCLGDIESPDSLIEEETGESEFCFIGEYIATCNRASGYANLTTINGFASFECMFNSLGHTCAITDFGLLHCCGNMMNNACWFGYSFEQIGTDVSLISEPVEKVGLYRRISDEDDSSLIALRGLDTLRFLQLSAEVMGTYSEDYSKAALPDSVLAKTPDKISFACYPNPFNSQIKIALYLPRPQEASIAIFDLFGRRIWQNSSQEYPAGMNSFTWQSGIDTPSGVFFVRLQTSDYYETKKIFLIK